MYELIKQAYISLSTDDSEECPMTQISYFDKASTAMRLSPYGLDSNPPEGCFSLIFSSMGDETVKFSIITDTNNRKKNLSAGEVAFSNYLAGSYIYLSEDGLINIKNNDENLKGLLSDLITAIKDIVTTGTAVTQTISATSQTALENIRVRVEKLLGEA